MHYAKEKAHKRRQELVQIEMSLRQAEERLAIDPSESNLEILEDLKMKYDSHFDYIAKGAIIRSNWYEKGEKRNKYFLGLEPHRGTKSCIRRLISSDGNLTTNPLKIMKEIEKFYSDLYSANDDTVYENHLFVKGTEIPKLSDDMRNICEGRLLVKECFDCLKIINLVVLTLSKHVIRNTLPCVCGHGHVCRQCQVSPGSTYLLMFPRSFVASRSF